MAATPNIARTSSVFGLGEHKELSFTSEVTTIEIQVPLTKVTIAKTVVPHQKNAAFAPQFRAVVLII